VLTGITRRRNKEQKPWAFMQLADRAGSTEMLVFPGKWEELQGLLIEDLAVLVRGKAMPEEDGTVKINASSIIALENARVDLPSLISIRVRVAQSADARAEELRKLFQSKPGKTSVRLKIEKPRDFVVLLDVDAKVLPDREFKAEVERICGPEALEVIAS
jgi:DNA polymerase-3 subunit alpha